MKPLSSPQPLSSLSSLILPSTLSSLPHLVLLCFLLSNFYILMALWYPLLFCFLPYLLPSSLPLFSCPRFTSSGIIPSEAAFSGVCFLHFSKPLSPPPSPSRVDRWWIDPVRVRMKGGGYMCQGV